MMVSPAALKTSADGNVARRPVGAGAYSFVSWADGEKIVVKRNEKYWKPNRPYPDGIEFAIIPELTTGSRSVTAGQNDLMYQLPPRQKAIMTGLDGPSFVQFAKLSGLVPVVGVVSGYCFAGNAAMLGCCDVIIATKNASIGMGGPAMIEGGGLGVYHPAEVGPVSFQSPNGVIDILVEDEGEATTAAQKYLSYFQGAVADWKAPDQRLLRRAIPENRLRVYDIRTVIDLLADEGSVLELRRDFGVGMCGRC